MKKHVVKAIILLTICALAAGICGCTAVSGSRRVCINEVVSSNTLSFVHERLGSPDWIELRNVSRETVDISGWGLSDNLKKPHKWVFPEGTRIEPNGYMIVALRSGGGNVDDVLCANFGLSKAGETLFLTDNYYKVVEQLEIPALDTDIAYARRPDGTFGFTDSPTPCAENNTEYIVGKLSDIVAELTESGVTITEVMPKNASTLECGGEYFSWCELRNETDKAADLSSFYLSEDDTRPQRWRLPHFELAPGDSVIIYMTGKNAVEGQICAPFEIGGDEHGMYLLNMRGEICSSIEWDVFIPYDVSVTANGYTTCATPNAYEAGPYFDKIEFAPMDGSDPLRINEVLVKNEYSTIDSYGDRSDWAELYNASGESVSLKNYYISDDAENPQKWRLPDVVIEPYGYIVVFLSGREQREGEIHAPFSLSADDGAFTLFCLDTMRIDTITIPENIGANISIGRNDAGEQVYYASPTPGAKNSTHSFATAENLSLTDMNGVYISEVCAVHNAGSGKDDWIEIHNAGGSSVSLRGWHITKDKDNLNMCELPDMSIPSGGYALIYANKYGGDLKTISMGISASGETLMLIDENGAVRDIFETGALRPGMTSGRVERSMSAERVFFTSATPAAANSASIVSGRVSAPSFSRRELYNTAEFELKLTCSTPNARIYYTLDASDPSQTSKLYESPIKVSSNTVIRAVAVASGMDSSDIVSATYLFSEPHTLPVMALTCDPTRFTELYSVTERSQRVEREAYAEYYEADGKLGTQFPCGLRANGSSTLKYGQKSLAVKLRGGYGRSSVTYPFFGKYEVKSFNRLLLRNSGQDNGTARVRDSFCSLAVEGMNIDNVATRPVVVYINGRYWGIYDLNEDQGRDYLEAHYGVDPSKVDIIRRNTGVLAGSNHDFKRVRAFALENDLSNDALFEKFAQWVDVDYFTDYLIAQTYFNNGDMFNQKYWRSQDYKVKWRPIFYDLDFGAKGSTGSLFTSYFNEAGVPSQDGSLTYMDIYIGLKKNAGWRERFAQRYVYLVKNQFAPERLNGILDDYVSQLEPEMQRHIARWGTPRTMEKWHESLDVIRMFINKRPENALNNLQRYFGISDEKMAEYGRKQG